MDSASFLLFRRAFRFISLRNSEFPSIRPGDGPPPEPPGPPGFFLLRPANERRSRPKWGIWRENVKLGPELCGVWETALIEKRLGALKGWTVRVLRRGFENGVTRKREGFRVLENEGS